MYLSRYGGLADTLNFFSSYIKTQKPLINKDAEQPSTVDIGTGCHDSNSSERLKTGHLRLFCKQIFKKLQQFQIYKKNNHVQNIVNFQIIK